jgi:transposase
LGHDVRLMLTRQRTQLGNAIRAHMAELGIVAAIGRKGLADLLEIIADESDARLPTITRSCLAMLERDEDKPSRRTIPMVSEM